MINKLILLEGMQGLDKSALAVTANDYLGDYIKTNLYMDGKGSPMDLACCAAIPTALIKSVLDLFPLSADMMKSKMKVAGKYAVINYGEILTQTDKSESQRIKQCLEGFEVFEGRVSAEAYAKIYQNRWKTYTRNNCIENELTICDSLYMQHHIDELILYQNQSELEIIDFLMSLVEEAMNLYPVLIYIKQKKIEKYLEYIDQDGANSGIAMWFNYYAKRIENSPFGIRNKLKGNEGLREYFHRRESIELGIIEMLSIKKYVVKNPEYGLSAIWGDIKAILDELFVDEIM